MLIESIYAFLKGTSAVDDLVEGIEFDALPQGYSLPAIDMELINSRRDHCLAGLAGTVNSRVALDCYGTTRKQAHAVADAIVTSGISQLRGKVNGSGAVIHSIQVNGPDDAVEEVDPGTDDRRFVSTVVLDIVWSGHSDS